MKQTALFAAAFVRNQLSATFAAIVAVLLLCAAAAPSEKSTAAPAPANLTDEQQFRVMRAFGAAFPDLQKFALAFPSTPFLVSRTGTGKASMNGVLQIGRYAVLVFVSGTFDPDFTQLQSAHFDSFAGHDMTRPLRPNEARAPQQFDPADLGRFCDNPTAYLNSKFGHPDSK